MILWLEKEEETLSDIEIGVADEDLLSRDIEDDDVDPYEVREGDEHVLFKPLCLYRNALSGTVTIDIDLEDIDDLKKLHIVVARYARSNEANITSGQWEIVKVCKTRREAKEVEFSIEDDSYEGDKVWEQHGCVLEYIDIYSVDLED